MATDADIAAAILEAKSLGVAMGGAVSAGGARFERVSEVRGQVQHCDYVVGQGFPSDGNERIRTNVLTYAARFFSVGETIYPARFYSPVNAIPGHVITALTFLLSDDSALPTTPNLNVLYTLAEGDVTITTSAS